MGVERAFALTNEKAYVRLLVGTLLVLCCIACSSSLSFKKISGSEYYSVDQGAFDRFIVHHPQALDNYEQVIFSALHFDKLTIKKSGRKGVDDSWKDLTASDKKVFAKYFKDELLEVFGGSSADTLFGLGTERNEKTLYAEVRLLKLLPLVAMHGENLSGTVSEKATETFGSLVIQVVLIDSVTEEFIAILEDGRNLSTGSSMKTMVNVAQQSRVWRSAFRSWLGDLKNVLAQAQSGASLE